ncbi:RNA polymerase sigma factor [Paraconexibacter sp. AEG42_29]|uniref:RNA polymerase sigma factor n=1 Tax=Paraconexibacter sp. AEG42_29 TaxID=2997339 RepID=UPI00339D7DC8
MAGDADAFVAFYRRHLAAIVGFFLRRTADRELTADLTAEVFAAAFSGAHRYRPGERPALAWLYGIAGHKLADSRRRGRVEDQARRQLQMQPLLVDDEALARVDEIAGSDLGQGVLTAALDALPADQRIAVVARVVDERAYSSIAAELACSELVVRQKVSRGLKRMRTQIESDR